MSESDPSDADPQNEPVLIFVHRERNEAYFGPKDSIGDDWDDHFWSYNAGKPYRWDVRVVWIDGYWDRADDGFSVNEVNAGRAPWLWSPDHCVAVAAGVTVDEFCRLIGAGQGLTWVVPDHVIPREG